jgi:type II secretory pathway pseudopilin PulG
MLGVKEKIAIGSQRKKSAVECRGKNGFTPLEVRSEGGRPDSAGFVLRGFTLVELLVVVGGISVLMGIVLPVCAKARRQARVVLGMSNQRQIVYAVNLYAIDNDGRYPESVATIGAEITSFWQGPTWNWQEPTMMTACIKRSAGLHRSMGAYLRRYIEDASIMFCPNAPRKYRYLQQSWDAGDEWDNPETMPQWDSVFGIYCFYWNYTGYLGPKRNFRGPRGHSYRRGQSRLLVSDYFGYCDGRSPNAYSSCEEFRRGDITEGSPVSSAYWSLLKLNSSISPDTLRIKLHAGYTDGHVGSYSASETVPMKVIRDRSTNEPYPYWMRKGDFYLPANGLR